MKPHRALATLLSPALLVVVTACGAGGSDGGGPEDVSSGTTGEAAAVEAAVVDFFDAITAYDYDALRRRTTSDFELVEDSLVLDLSGFVDLIEPYEDRDAGITYRLSDFVTEVRGPVAWTRYRNRAVLQTGEDTMRLRWLESAVLLREDGAWRIDRLHSTPVTGRGGG